MGPLIQVKCLEIWLFWGYIVDLEGWHFEALEHWRYPRVHLVSFLFFYYVFWFYMNGSLMQERVTLVFWVLRGLEVFRLQKHLTWVIWVFKGLFESFEGAGTSKAHDLRGLSTEKFIWNVWMCLDFKNIWLECFEWFKAYLWVLSIVWFL